MEQVARYAPWVVAILGLGYVIGTARPAPTARDANSKDPRDRMNLRAFGELPFLDQGRYKPIDSWARQHLAKISGRQEYADTKDKTQPAVRWMLNLIALGLFQAEDAIYFPDKEAHEWLGLKVPEDGQWSAIELEQKLRGAGKDKELTKLALKQKNGLELEPVERNVLNLVQLALLKAPAANQMAEKMTKNDLPSLQKVFRVDFDQVLHMLKLERREGLRYSYAEITGSGSMERRVAYIQFRNTAQQAAVRQSKKVNLDIVSQRALDLAGHLNLHDGVIELMGPKLVPDAEFSPKGWKSLRKALASYPDPNNKAGTLFVDIVRAYATGDADKFNEKVADYADLAREKLGKVGGPAKEEAPSPLYDIAYTGIYLAMYLGAAALGALSFRFGGKPLLLAAGACLLVAMGLHAVPLLVSLRADAEISTLAAQEAWLNKFSPFTTCAAFYIAALVLAAASWMGYKQLLLRSAFALFLVTLVVHTFSLVFRMYLQGRPPVVNLYSSAIFIGWGCALVCAFLEWRVAWNGVPTAVGGLLGFGTMLIAHFLGTGDDTMKVLQAVLDTNFWLATHVTTVTLGYTATFVAGFLALVYLYLVLAGLVLAYYRQRDERQHATADYSPAFALVCPVVGVAVGGMLGWGAAEVAGLAAGALIGYLLVGGLVVEARRGADAPLGENQYVFYLAALGVAMLPALLLAALYLGTLYLITKESPFDHSMGVPVAVCILAFGLAYAIYLSLRYLVRNPEEKPGEVAQTVQWMEGLELNLDSSKLLSNLVYGVVCFAVLLSFVGTVLGGIWADQSWGRFWGWDPKENGAILVVVINALILHARWGGMIKDRGLVMLALVGNMVTMWSWFGTNQLGIGLHSYGFNNALIQMCRWFWLSHLGLIGLAAIPLRYWKAYAVKPETAPAGTAKSDGIKGKGGKPAKGAQQPDIGIQPA